MQRKSFLSNTAAVGLALSAKSPSLLASEKQIPLIDTHQHLWDLDLLQLDWNKKDSSSPLGRNFVTSDYIKATEGIDIAQVIYMEVNVASHHKRKEAEHVLSLCRSDEHPTTAAIISGPVETDEFKSYIHSLKHNPEIKGLRRVLHGNNPKGICLKPQFVKNMQLLGDLNLSFDLCMRPDDLGDALTLVKQCPNTRFIIDHCGNVQPSIYGNHSKESIQARQRWQRDMVLLADEKEVYCKISGVVAKMKRDQWQAEDIADSINFCLDTFGPDRVVFGSDWPVCLLGSTFSQWVTALREIVKDRPYEDQKKLFHDNAITCYRLES